MFGNIHFVRQLLPRLVLFLLLFFTGEWRSPYGAAQGTPGARTPLHIAGFFPETGHGFPIAPVAKPAAHLAIEVLNNNTDILPEFEFVLNIYDTAHSAKQGMRRYLDMINSGNTSIFMLGPLTSSVAVHVCVAASSWNIVQISSSVHSAELEDRELYPFFFRSVPSDAMLNAIRLDLLRHFGWSRVAIVYEKHQANLYYASLPSLSKSLERDGVKVLLLQPVNVQDYADTVKTLKRLDARIIIAHAHFMMARNLFCEAYLQGMYGARYVWILPGWVGSRWWLDDNPDPAYNCTAQQLTEAAEGHFSTNYLHFATDNTSVLGMITGHNSRLDITLKFRVNWSETEFYRIPVTTLDGLRTVKEFQEQTKSEDKYSAYTFDAMISIGHVLHAASRDRGLDLSSFSYDNDTYSSVFVEELKKMEMTGISGPLAFNKVGNRLGVSVLEQCQGNKVPRDGPLRSRDTHFLPLPAMVIISVLSSLGFIATCIFIAFNLKFASLPIIKLSSPNMNNVVSAGCSLGYIAVIMFGLDGRQLGADGYSVMCHARTFVLCVAYSLAFGALFFKTWRVHRIMGNKKLERISLKDRQLIMWIAGLVLLDVFFLCLWSGIDPLQRTLVPLPLEVDAHDSDHIVAPFVEKCTCAHEEYWLGAMLVYKGLLLLFGLFLAWETRHIQVKALNDSRYIGMSVYNLAVVSIVGVLAGFLINDENYVGNYIISSFFIIIAVTITLCFVFVPKIHAVYKNPKGEVSVGLSTHRTAPFNSTDTTYTVGRPSMGYSRPSRAEEEGEGRPSVEGDGVSFTPSTSKVSPLVQNALQIAIQHRLEKLLAERDNQIVQLKKELISTKYLGNSTVGVESVT